MKNSKEYQDNSLRARNKDIKKLKLMHSDIEKRKPTQTIIRQQSAPTYYHRSPVKIANIHKKTVLRQKSAPTRHGHGSPQRLVKQTSTPSMNSNIPVKTLTVVRGESCSLIDIDTYIGSLGSVEKFDSGSDEIVPTAMLSPKPRARINLILKKPVEKEEKIPKLVTFSLSFCLLVALLFIIFRATETTNIGKNNSDAVDLTEYIKEIKVNETASAKNLWNILSQLKQEHRKGENQFV